jgi:prepilin-type N-terminal cleavage/methylation domain-containing protein
MKNHSTQKGFTLIEVVVYLGLFSVLMSGVIVSAYNIIESEKRNETKGLLNNEAEYIVGKINWALTGAQVVNIPTPGTSGSLLSLNRVISTANGVPTITSVSIGLSVTDITITIGSNPSEKLNNNDTEITNLTFSRNSGTSSGSPESVTATATVRMRTPNGSYITRDISTTSYIRQ